MLQNLPNLFKLANPQEAPRSRAYFTPFAIPNPLPLLLQFQGAAILPLGENSVSAQQPLPFNAVRVCPVPMCMFHHQNLMKTKPSSIFSS